MKYFNFELQIKIKGIFKNELPHILNMEVDMDI